MLSSSKGTSRMIDEAISSQNQLSGRQLAAIHGIPSSTLGHRISLISLPTSSQYTNALSTETLDANPAILRPLEGIICWKKTTTEPPPNMTDMPNVYEPIANYTTSLQQSRTGIRCSDMDLEKLSNISRHLLRG